MGPPALRCGLGVPVLSGSPGCKDCPHPHSPTKAGAGLTCLLSARFTPGAAPVTCARRSRAPPGPTCTGAPPAIQPLHPGSNPQSPPGTAHQIDVSLGDPTLLIRAQGLALHREAQTPDSAHVFIVTANNCTRTSRPAASAPRLLLSHPWVQQLPRGHCATSVLGGQGGPVSRWELTPHS